MKGRNKEHLANCSGFEENLVLAKKGCFLEVEMRCLLIVRSSSSPNQYYYHSRACPSLARSEEMTGAERCTSATCQRWFSRLVKSADSREEEPASVEEEDDLCGLSLGDQEGVLLLLEEEEECPATKEPRSLPLEKLKCEFCDKKFRMRPSLNKHKERQHKDELKNYRLMRAGEYACSFCGLRFDKKPSMQRHVARKHAAEWEQGQGQAADDRPTTAAAEEEEHQDPAEIMTSPTVVTSAATDMTSLAAAEQPGSAQLRCPVDSCGEEVSSDGLLRAHLRQVHSSHPRRGRRPREPPDLELAARLGIGPSLRDLPYDQPEACELCPKLFESRLKMYWHLKNVHHRTLKTCPLCDVKVKKLSDHMKRQHTHRDDARFVCEQCGTRFRGQSGYQFHLAGHTGEKNFSCRTCGKSFRTSTEAYKCERGHQGIFRWRCSQCTFRSHQRNKFIRHLRTHTKSQPYRCPLCEHTAARKDYLQKHLLKVHSNCGGTLEQLERLYPQMYNIEDEKLQLITSISYDKIDPLTLTSGIAEEQGERRDKGQQEHHHLHHSDLGPAQQAGQLEHCPEDRSYHPMHQFPLAKSEDHEEMGRVPEGIIQLQQTIQQGVFYLRRDLPGHEPTSYRTVQLTHRESLACHPDSHETAAAGEPPGSRMYLSDK